MKIWTDGSCLGNPGPGGWGVLLISSDGEIEMSGGVENTTNNRMELLAAIEALEALYIPRQVELFSDSTYVINGITKWIVGWKERDWKKVKNRDLWERLDKARDSHDVTWTWVRGHSGDKNNERVDKLAVVESKLIKSSLYPKI